MVLRGATPGLALAAVLLAGASAAEEETASKSIRLVWLDPIGATVGVDGVARDECRSVLERADLDVVWRKGSGGEQARPGEIRVILVDHFVMDAQVRRSIMGATPARTREHPVVWIHTGSVLATLGFPPDFPILDLPLRARRDLGVAVGRVVAHEVVHVLVPSLKHDRGLMSPMLTPETLTSSRLSLDPGAAELVRAALQGRPGPARPEAGVLAASGAVAAGPPTRSTQPSGPRPRAPEPRPLRE